MKKVVIGLIVVLIVAGVTYAIITNISTKEVAKNEIANTDTESDAVENEEEGFDILVSKEEITVKKGEEESFEITFTNPDLTSIREYIHCDEQSNVVVVKYSDLVDDKITVYVEGLKAGDTEIEVCDFNFQDVKKFVKVHVVE
jgi:uncharacterized protein YxeA